MDRQQLLDRQKASEARFSELQRQADAKRQEIEQIEDELKRYQGEYRLLLELINQTPEEPAQANVITAEPAEESHGRKQPAKR